MLNKEVTAQRQPDRSGKPGEGLCVGFCAGLAANSRI